MQSKIATMALLLGSSLLAASPVLAQGGATTTSPGGAVPSQGTHSPGTSDPAMTHGVPNRPSGNTSMKGTEGCGAAAMHNQSAKDARNARTGERC